MKETVKLQFSLHAFHIDFWSLPHGVGKETCTLVKMYLLAAKSFVVC